MSSRQVLPSDTRVLGRGVLADQVYDELIVHLIGGTLEPGTALSIDGLARELGVSATPVREALARLEATGVVSRVALKGYRIAPLLSADEMLQLLDARLVIEPVNAENACSHATPEFLDELRATVERQSAAPTTSTFAVYREFWAADEDFHRLIAEQAGNPFMLAAYDSLGGQIQRFRHFGKQGVLDAERALSEHQAIVQAIASGSPAEARAAMENHIRNVQQRTLAGT